MGSDITQSQLAGHQHSTKLQSNFGKYFKIVCSLSQRVRGVEVITFLSQSVSHLTRMEDLLARLWAEYSSRCLHRVKYHPQQDER